MSLNFTVDLDLAKVRTPVEQLPKQIERLIGGVMLRQENVSTAYMKQNAPWTDRTGNARAGLDADYALEGDTHVLTLHHGVSYGIWLEVRYAGRYAIILDSLQRAGADVMRLLDKGMARL